VDVGHGAAPGPVTLEIRQDLLPVLEELARRERRTTHQQALWLVEKALEAVLEAPHWAYASPGQGCPDGGVAQSTDC
jgi:predicted transcriptional regulator